MDCLNTEHPRHCLGCSSNIYTFCFGKILNLLREDLEHLGAALDTEPGHGMPLRATLALHGHYLRVLHLPLVLALDAVCDHGTACACCCFGHGVGNR